MELTYNGIKLILDQDESEIDTGDACDWDNPDEVTEI